MIIKLTNEPGLILPQRKWRCGQKMKTDFKDYDFLLRESEIDPRKSCSDFQKDLATAVVQVLDSAVCCRLLEVCQKDQKPVKK
jgi:hypothetical protein